MKFEELKRFIEDLNQLPTLSPIALKIVEIAEEESTSVKEITRLIESDQALSSKILRISNYALLRSGKHDKVGTVKRATAVLGVNAVRSIALSLIVINLFEDDSSMVFNIAEFWRHSAACAIASELFAKKFSYPQPEEAFIAGLLHDLGKLIFFQWKRKEYEQVVNEANRIKVRLLELEEKHLGMGHTHAAKLLMEHWKFPPSLVTPAWLHHQPLSEFKQNRFEELPFIVKCADCLCHIQRFGESGNPVSDLDEEQLRLVTGLSFDEMEKIAADVLTLFDEVSKSYNWEGTTPDLYLSAVSRANQELIQLQITLQETKSQMQIEKSINRTIYNLHEALSTPMSIGDAIEKAINLLGEIIPYCRIMGFVFISNNRTLEGCLKTNKKETTDHILLPFKGNPDDIGKRAKLREQISFIENMVERLKQRSSVYSEIIDSLHSSNLKVEPLYTGEGTIGMIMIDMAPSKWSQREKGSFLRKFCLALSTSLERFILNDKLDTEMENIAQMARKIEDVQTRLYQSERLASVGRLAAGAAHEINNPLAAISLKAQLMHSQAKNDKDRDSIKIVIEQSNRISKIVKDLMGVARPSEPKIEPTSIEIVIEKTLCLLENRTLVSGVEVKKDFKPDIPLINADGKQLEQVFLNLSINAIQAMESGGTFSISVNNDIETHNLCLEFSDTGSGINPTDLPNIFDPFYTSKKDSDGTGLGLAICKSIIEAHCGSISVESEPGKGTKFIITLPLTKKPILIESNVEKPQLIHKSTEKQPPESLSVLVADDEEVLRSILTDALIDEGYNVDNAIDGVDALSKLCDKAYDLMILDLRMPRKEGIEVLETIKKESIGSQKVIVLSGTANDEEFKAAKDAGAFACLKKPFDIKELLNVMANAITPDG